MNSFYTLHNTLISTLEGCALVNKVTFGDTSDIDNDRNSKYPLVHIVYGATTSNNNENGLATEGMAITFYVLDIVHELADHTTNLVDVWNNTNEICKFIVKEFYTGSLYDLHFKLNGQPTRDMFKDTQTNGLAGYQLDLNITLPFNYNLC